MKWNDLYNWRIGNKLSDEWWCAFDTTVDGPLPLKRIISLADKRKATELNVCHVTSIGNDGWVLIRVERRSTIPVLVTRPTVRKHVEPDRESWFDTYWPAFAGAVAGVLFLGVTLLIGTAINNADRQRLAAERKRQAVEAERDAERAEERLRYPSPSTGATGSGSYYSSAPATRFTMSSDGNTWNSASEAEKRRMAAGMAAVSKKGNSANFYYDALDTTYNTNDAYTKRQTMKDVHTLIEAASSTLRKSQRKY